MAQVIEAVYEDGVIKPLERFVTQEGVVLLLEIREIKGIFSPKEVEVLKRMLKKTKKYELTKEELVSYGKTFC